MARELNANDIAELDPERPWRYETERLMQPFWRTFLFDEHEQRQAALISANASSRSNETFLRFVARTTGISFDDIDCVYESGDVLSVIVFERHAEVEGYVGLTSREAGLDAETLRLLKELDT